jgi:hypothetical protein
LIPRFKGAGAAVLAGAYGLLIMALREGLTVRGFYNASIAASVTIATGVSQWSDLHSSGNNYVQATGGNQPAYNANDGTLRARGTITGDGTDDFMTCAYDAPAPGTTPIYWFGIVKQPTWAGPPNFILSGVGTIIGDSVNVIQNGATPNLRLNNGVAVNNAGLAVNTWGRLELQLTNSTADYFKLITTNTTGTNAGNETGTGGRFMFGIAAGALAANAAFAALLCCEGTASSRFRSFADYWTLNYFGAGLV